MASVCVYCSCFLNSFKPQLQVQDQNVFSQNTISVQIHRGETMLLRYQQVLAFLDVLCVVLLQSDPQDLSGGDSLQHCNEQLGVMLWAVVMSCGLCINVPITLFSNMSKRFNVYPVNSITFSQGLFYVVENESDLSYFFEKNVENWRTCRFATTQN